MLCSGGSSPFPARILRSCNEERGWQPRCRMTSRPTGQKLLRHRTREMSDSRQHACLCNSVPEDVKFVEREEGVRDGQCAHCGNSAIWRFLSEDESRIDVICPDCGRYEIARPEFDLAQSEIPGPEEEGPQ